MHYVNRKAPMVFSFNFLIKTEVFSRSGSHVHCKCGNIWQTVQVRDVVTTNSDSSDDLK